MVREVKGIVFGVKYDRRRNSCIFLILKKNRIPQKVLVTNVRIKNKTFHYKISKLKSQKSVLMMVYLKYCGVIRVMSQWKGHITAFWWNLRGLRGNVTSYGNNLSKSLKELQEWDLHMLKCHIWAITLLFVEDKRVNRAGNRRERVRTGSELRLLVVEVQD